MPGWDINFNLVNNNFWKTTTKFSIFKKVSFCGRHFAFVMIVSKNKIYFLEVRIKWSSVKFSAVWKNHKMLVLLNQPQTDFEINNIFPLFYIKTSNKKLLISNQLLIISLGKKNSNSHIQLNIFWFTTKSL